MNRIKTIIFLVVGTAVILILAAFGTNAWASPQKSETKTATERADKGYYTIIGENDDILHQTAHILSKGDELITADNMRYQITEVKGDRAYTRLVGKEAEAKLDVSSGDSIWSRLLAQGEKNIGIYHTHSDESYVPTDGTESVYGDGGILKVGKVFADKLKEMGYNVHHSTRAHDPHDVNAYYRSRRTASQLLQKNLSALFDIHRDAVPPQVYAGEVNGQEITKVKFVVGRTNPRFQSNLEFAKQLKAAVDKTHPGVVQGILIAKSDFNQDLAPRNMLVEVGAHTNSREAAERGVAMFAEALPKVLGTPGSPTTEIPDAENRGSGWTVFWIILLVVGAGLAYLYLNTGSLEGALDQLRNLYGRLLKRRG
jgi:stage II sporulation protein P